MSFVIKLKMKKIFTAMLAYTNNNDLHAKFLTYFIKHISAYTTYQTFIKHIEENLHTLYRL